MAAKVFLFVGLIAIIAVEGSCEIQITNTYRKYKFRSVKAKVKVKLKFSLTTNECEKLEMAVKNTVVTGEG